MPVIPFTTTNPSSVPTASGGNVVDVNFGAGPYVQQAQSGKELAAMAGDFAEKYINAKMQVAAADQTADLSTKLNDIQVKAAKIPDRAQATAFYDAEAAKLYDDWSGKSNNTFVKAHVESWLKPQVALRRSEAQRQSFELESQTNRGKLITQLDGYKKQASEATDPRQRDLLVSTGISAIDTHVAGGWLNPEAAAKAKIDFESDTYRSIIDQAMARNPREGLVLYDRYKGKLNFSDSHVTGVMAEDKRVEVKANDLVSRRLPVLGTYGSASKWATIIEGAAAGASLSPALVGAVASAESEGNEGAISPAGARGPMQFMPGTAKDMGVVDPHNPLEAIPAGSKYLAQQIERFGSVEHGLVAYNWGPENARKWIAAGADPSKLPQETRDYVKKVMERKALFEANAKTGDALTNYEIERQKLKLELLADNTMDPRVKAAALQQIDARGVATHGMVTAERKKLDDQAQTMAFGLFNGTYKTGGFASIAQGYRANGDSHSAAVYDFLAKYESVLQDFGSLPPQLQNTFAHILPGAAGKIATSLMTNQRLDRKEMRDYGTEQEKLVHAGIADPNLDPMAVMPNALEAASAFAAAGDGQRAKRIEEAFKGAVDAKYKGQLPPLQLAEELRRLKEVAESSGGLDLRTATAMKVLQQAKGKKDELWKNDPMAAGENMPGVGRLQPFDPTANEVNQRLWANERARQAAAIGSVLGKRVAMFTGLEIDLLQADFKQTPMAQRQVKLTNLANLLPPDQIQAVSDKLTGKDEMADAWAVALTHYARMQPGDRDIANSLVLGSSVLAEGGPQGKSVISLENPQVLDQINSQVGLALAGVDPRIRRGQNNAILARYAGLMNNKPAEKLNTQVLNQAIADIVGVKTRINGADTILPTGVDQTQFFDALSSMTPADIPPLKFPGITPAKIRAEGQFQPAGDGTYIVRMPDPRGNNTDPLYRSDTGREWFLDIRPLVARSGSRGDIQPGILSP